MKNTIKIVLLIIIVAFSVYKISLASSSEEDANEKITTKIDYIRCKSFRRKGKSSTLKVKFKEKTYIVLIPKDVCRKLNLGDSINLYYSKKEDKVYCK